MEQARLPLTPQSLINLPKGAEYRKQNGRASASVRNEGDSIVVYATCDSLQALVEQYERSIMRYEADLQHFRENVRQEKQKISKPARIMFYAFLAGLAAGMVIIIKTKRIWQKVF